MTDNDDVTATAVDEQSAGYRAGYADGWRAAIAAGSRMLAGASPTPPQLGWLQPKFQEVNASLPLTAEIVHLGLPTRLFVWLNNDCGVRTIGQIMEHTMHSLIALVRQQNGNKLTKAHQDAIQLQLLRVGYIMLQTLPTGAIQVSNTPA